MDAMSTRCSVTNEQVADDLGLTHSMVSRIRSGDRVPSIERMCVIADVLDWTLYEQADAKRNGEYADEFETHLTEKYGHTGVF